MQFFRPTHLVLCSTVDDMLKQVIAVDLHTESALFIEKVQHSIFTINTTKSTTTIKYDKYQQTEFNVTDSSCDLHSAPAEHCYNKQMSYDMTWYNMTHTAELTNSMSITLYRCIAIILLQADSDTHKIISKFQSNNLNGLATQRHKITSHRSTLHWDVVICRTERHIITLWFH